MKSNRQLFGRSAIVVALTWLSLDTAAAAGPLGSGDIKHVLLLSIDGMHAVDFYNCAHGIDGANGGAPYCPNLAQLSHQAIKYVNVVSSKPSDSFPGLAALVTGGSPKSTGLYYDVAFDRSLDAPTIKTGTGLAGGSCTPYGPSVGPAPGAPPFSFVSSKSIPWS